MATAESCSEALQFVYLKSKETQPQFADLCGSVPLTSSELAEVQAELASLSGKTETPYLKNLFSDELTSIDTQISQHERAAVLRAQRKVVEEARKNQSKPITSYAWDQSDLFVSVYVSFDGVGQLPEGSVQSQFDDQGFTLTVTDSKGQCQTLAVPNLCFPINTAKSKQIVKADRLVVKLKKTEKGQDWSGLDDLERKKKEKREARIQNGDLQGATTQQLLADMYEDADEEGKRSLNAAMAEGERKRQTERAKESGK